VKAIQKTLVLVGLFVVCGFVGAWPRLGAGRGAHGCVPPPSPVDRMFHACICFSRSANHTLMMDCRVTPIRPASSSRDWIIHWGRSTLTLRCASAGRDSLLKSSSSIIEDPIELAKIMEWANKQEQELHLSVCARSPPE